jgi:hypothetical protein
VKHESENRSKERVAGLAGFPVDERLTIKTAADETQ